MAAHPPMHSRPRRSVILVACAVGWIPAICQAGVVTTSSGMVLEGKLGYLPSIDENPMVANVAPGAQINKIVLLDDGLRRTYLPSHLVESVAESDPGGAERIRIRQRVASGRRAIGSVTAIRRIGPFDEYGRRVYSILTPRGPVDIFQGITEVSPVYTRVQGLVGKPSIRWDCRVATSSIPRETLSQVLRRQGNGQDPDARLAIVRLLFEAERYRDAKLELEEAMRDHPELAESESMKRLVVELQQYTAKRLVDEIELRQRAGQHGRVQALLAHFPEQGVASVTLQRVSEMAREYDTNRLTIESLNEQIESLCDKVPSPTGTPLIESLRAEIRATLSVNSLNRLQDFQRLRDDPKLEDDMRLSLVLSGWILGSGAATQNLAEAISVIRSRDLVVRYLRSNDEAERAELLIALGREEGGTPSRIARILSHLRPPLPTDSQPGRPPGNFVCRANGPSDSTIEYEIQLPEEYDPMRFYPAVVTLNAVGRSPADQIDWWAGAYSETQRTRLGQGTRRGYIVVAPKWLEKGKRRYEYSGREHAAVLASLRDACRRFSIDTDRVFLSGHSLGGDAAWDIGLAHPDLWAGVIPIVAVGDYGPNAPKYIAQYWPNAALVPLYFVIGELDGDKLERNRREFDRYLRKGGSSRVDVMITEYIGRGHEHFYDEIHRIFEWMALHRRNFTPTEYACVTMRPFDNFFYNLELSQLPKRSLVGPYEWPADSAGPSAHEFARKEAGTLRVKTGAATARLWLSPEVVDLGSRLSIIVNNRTRNYSATPQVKTMLEDARTRADRQHPFWAEVDLVTGNRPS